VEPPGTAPGSDPLITCAFMPIVRANPNSANIGAGAGRCKVARVGLADGAREEGGRPFTARRPAHRVTGRRGDCIRDRGPGRRRFRIFLVQILPPEATPERGAPGLQSRK